MIAARISNALIVITPSPSAELDHARVLSSAKPRASEIFPVAAFSLVIGGRLGVSGNLLEPLHPVEPAASEVFDVIIRDMQLDADPLGSARRAAGAMALGVRRFHLHRLALGGRAYFPAQSAPSISIPHVVNVADGVSETEADHFTKCPGRRRCCFA